jgi:hypothetical protein
MVLAISEERDHDEKKQSSRLPCTRLSTGGKTMNNFQETKNSLIQAIDVLQAEIQDNIPLSLEEYKGAHELLNTFLAYQETLQELVENRSVKVGK